MRFKSADAARLLVAGHAAWQACFEQAELTSGQRIFFNEAMGAVGEYAVKWGHPTGAHVIAMCF